MSALTLRPALTMSDVYGSGTIFVPRAHDAACDWLPSGPLALDFMTGSALTFAGDMRVVCSAGFGTRIGLDLLAAAGIEPARSRIHFRAGEALDAVAQAAADPGDRLILQHAYPSEAWQSGRSWIDPALLRYLNNKANLAALAPAGHVPERRIVDRAAWFVQDEQSLPIGIKAVSDQSSGGGSAVMICRTAADLRAARTKFARCEKIVVEAVLDIVGNPCLHFAAISPNDVRYLGFADQDVAPDGTYRGNWIDLGAALPQAWIDPALEVVRRAAAMGYCGFAGIDLAVTGDHRIYILDLNFRLNASTAAVLFKDAIKERRGTAVMHLRKLQGCADGEHFAHELLPLVTGGDVLPLSFFDAAAAGYRDELPRAQALVIGESREQVVATENDLAARGIN